MKLTEAQVFGLRVARYGDYGKYRDSPNFYHPNHVPGRDRYVDSRTVGALRRAGLVDVTSRSLLVLTDAGRDALAELNGKGPR